MGFRRDKRNWMISVIVFEEENGFSMDCQTYFLDQIFPKKLTPIRRLKVRAKREVRVAG
jgi:hypothetical protein